MSKQFTKNEKYKGIYVSKKCAFSMNKYSEENMICYNEYIEFKNSVYYNNFIFADEKSLQSMILKS